MDLGNVRMSFWMYFYMAVRILIKLKIMVNGHEEVRFW